MVKKILYAALCITVTAALFSTPAHATKARDLGLGLYETPWMIDGLQSYIFKNPAYLSKQKGQIFFVRTDENFGGLIYSPMNELNIGVFSGVSLNDNIWNSTGPESFYHVGGSNGYDVKANGYQPLSGVNPGGATIDLLDPDGNSSTAASAEDYRKSLDQQDASLMASYIWNKMAFGLSIGYGSAWSEDSYEQTVPDERDDAYAFSSTQIDAIIAWLFAFNDEMDVDVDVHYTQYILKNTYEASIPGIDTDLSYESDGAMDLVFGAGFNWDYTSVHKLHTKVGFGMLNHSAKGTGKATGNLNPDDAFNVEEKYERTGSEFSLGIADEMRLTRDTIAFAGLNFIMKSFDYSYSGSDENHAITDEEEYSGSASSREVPLILGLETKISENWTARFSMSHNLWDPAYETIDRKTDAETQLSETSSASDEDVPSDTELNLGLSYQLGNFRFDWLANIDIFIEGPFIISGKSTPIPGQASTPMSIAFAATYLFDGPAADGTVKDDKGILEGQ